MVNDIERPYRNYVKMVITQHYPADKQDVLKDEISRIRKSDTVFKDANFNIKDLTGFVYLGKETQKDHAPFIKTINMTAKMLKGLFGDLYDAFGGYEKFDVQSWNFSEVRNCLDHSARALTMDEARLCTKFANTICKFVDDSCFTELKRKAIKMCINEALFEMIENDFEPSKKILLHNIEKKFYVNFMYNGDHTLDLKTICLKTCEHERYVKYPEVEEIVQKLKEHHIIVKASNGYCLNEDAAEYVKGKIAFDNISKYELARLRAFTRLKCVSHKYFDKKMIIRSKEYDKALSVNSDGNVELSDKAETWKIVKNISWNEKFGKSDEEKYYSVTFEDFAENKKEKYIQVSMNNEMILFHTENNSTWEAMDIYTDPETGIFYIYSNEANLFLGVKEDGRVYAGDVYPVEANGKEPLFPKNAGFSINEII